jgi:hypothetical protein
MRTSFVVRVLSAVVVLSIGLSSHAGGRMTHRSACSVLKATVARRDSLPVTGPPGTGWFCDFTTGNSKSWYVVALRSGQKCAGICSNLMGWYAVSSRTGTVREWDVGENKLGGPL